MSSTSEHPAVAGDQPTAASGFSWRKLLSFSAIAAGLVIGYSAIVVFNSADPPFIVMLGSFILGGIVSMRRGKAGVVGAVMATLASLMFTALAGPGIVQTSPLAPRHFIAATITLTLTLTVIVSAIASATRGRRGFAASRAASVVGVVSVLAIVSLVATSLYSAARFKSVAAREGDIAVTTEEVKFRPDEVEADAGTLSVHITNRDDVVHTFTIDQLNVDVAIPGGKETRVTFRAEAGKYRFYCKLHPPSMDGTLEVP